MASNLLITIVVGAVIGWIACKLFNLNGGLIKNILLGVGGGFVGGLVLRLIGFKATTILGSIISGVVGAGIIVFVARRLSK
ncbi:MAG: GlsB/YeaQ/YmgE family stress response membrane protein [Lachnospiraceae bacterium]|nr:GlsB/YeaQ/YmgE family stress response membrane protein [Lachnospiraceae bacterium]